MEENTSVKSTDMRVDGDLSVDSEVMFNVNNNVSETEINQNDAQLDKLSMQMVEMKEIMARQTEVLGNYGKVLNVLRERINGVSARSSMDKSAPELTHSNIIELNNDEQIQNEKGFDILNQTVDRSNDESAAVGSSKSGVPREQVVIKTENIGEKQNQQVIVINANPLASITNFQCLQEDNYEAERFVSAFKIAAAENNWSEAQMRVNFENKIVGKARSIYFDGLGNNNLFTMEERFREFKLIFSKQPKGDARMKLFQECRQHKNEKIACYKLRLTGLSENLKIRLCNAPDVYEELLLAQFKQGVEAKFRKEIIKRGKLTFSEAVDFAMELEEGWAWETNSVDENSAVAISNEQLSRQLRNLQEEMRNLKVSTNQGVPQNRTFIPTCNKCKKRGHTTEKCYANLHNVRSVTNNLHTCRRELERSNSVKITNNPTYTRLKEVHTNLKRYKTNLSHRARLCVATSRGSHLVVKGDNPAVALTKDEENLSFISFDKFYKDKPIIKIKVFNRTMRALVDTGAENTIINQRYVSAGLLRKLNDYVIVTSPVAKKSMRAYNVKAQINILNKNFVYPALVAPLQEDRSYQIILGFDLLTSYKAVIDHERRRVGFNFKKLPRQPIVSPRPANKNAAHSSKVTANPNENEELMELLKLLKLSEIEINNTHLEDLTNIIIRNRSILLEDVTQVKGATVKPYTPNFSDHTPIYQRQYRIPHGLYNSLRNKLNKMEQAEIIKKTSSQWNSPILVIPKPQQPNEVRIVMDLRKINKKIEPFNYPLMRIEDILERLGGAKYFSNLDLNNGYHNIKLSEDIQERFAFQVPWGRYCFTRLIQGCLTSAGVFQQIMNECLHDVINKGHVLVYLDDIIVFSSTIEEHLEVLNEVFNALRKVNMVLKPSKCHLFKRSLQFLGHYISKDGCLPLDDNIKTILDLPTPTTVTKLRSFLGSCSFYRRFIGGYSEIAMPLYSLLKKGKNKLTWNEDAEQAFQQLKVCLTTAPVLAYPDFNKTFLLKCDASNSSVAAVLEQKNEDGHCQPIAYCSRKINKAERNYATIEREALAIVYGLAQFKHLTYGKKVILMTDHRPLSYIFDLKDSNSRVVRWLIQIQDHDLHMEYIPGKLNTVADMLSRSHEIDSSDHQIATLPRKPLSTDRIYEAQNDDRKCMELINQLQNVNSTNHDYILDEDQILLKRISLAQGYGSVYRVLVPESLKHDVMLNYHDTISSGHLSFSKTLWKIKRFFTWDNMLRDVRSYVGSCDKCQKRNLIRTKAPIQSVVPPSGCMERLSVDILGPFQPTSRGNRYIVLWTDHFSRMSWGSALRNQEANTIAKDYMDNVFSRYGGCKELLSDQGPQLTGKIMSSLCEHLGISRALTSSYHPNANGVSERINSKVLNVLAHFCDKAYSDWDLLLKYVLQALNNVIHRSSGMAPFYIFHGFHQIEPAVGFSDYCFQEGDIQEIVEEMMERLEVSKVIVYKNLMKASEVSCRQRNKGRRLREFGIGKLVLCLDPTSFTGKNRKLRPRYTGPWTIVKRTGVVNYQIRQVENPSITKFVHVDKLKEYQHRYWLDDREPEAIMPENTAVELSVKQKGPIYYTSSGEPIDLTKDDNVLEDPENNEGILENFEIVLPSLTPDVPNLSGHTYYLRSSV